MVTVTAGDWLALSALILTGLSMAGGVVYKMGQLTGAVRDLTVRVGAIERKLDRRRALVRVPFVLLAGPVGYPEVPVVTEAAADRALDCPCVEHQVVADRHKLHGCQPLTDLYFGCGLSP